MAKAIDGWGQNLKMPDELPFVRDGLSDMEFAVATAYVLGCSAAYDSIASEFRRFFNEASDDAKPFLRNALEMLAHECFLKDDFEFPAESFGYPEEEVELLLKALAPK